MSRAPRTQIIPSDLPKETKNMPRCIRKLSLLLAAVLLLLVALPVVSASAAEPWWQVLTGSRPTHMWEPKDATETQEVSGQSFFGMIFAVEVEVAGEVVGCLGSGSLAPFGGPTADEVCEGETGFPASETAAELEEILEAPYGLGQVQVSGGRVGCI